MRTFNFFVILIIFVFLLYEIKFTFFYTILLKLAEIVCIIVKIDPNENDEIRLTLWEKGSFNLFFIYFFIFLIYGITGLSLRFLFNSFETCTEKLYHHRY